MLVKSDFDAKGRKCWICTVFKIFCEQNIEISTCAEKIAEHLDIDLIICISDSCEVEFLIALLPFI